MNKITEWICGSDLRTNVAIAIMWLLAIIVMSLLSVAVQAVFRYLVT